MRLGDLDELRDKVCDRFNLPMVIGEMDNPRQPKEIVQLLRILAKRRPRYIGRKPQGLYEQAADCIERLLTDHDDD